LGLATTGGTSPTYTELLTCLELQRDAQFAGAGVGDDGAEVKTRGRRDIC